MISVALSQLAEVLSACLIGADREISAVSTDTRTISPSGQSLFVALAGEKFDGHNFAEQALANGAAALLVSRRLELDIPQLLVEDTRVALGQLGAWLQQQCPTPTVAITGSCGKTTVKEMVASIMAPLGQVLFTAGNFNNDIGVPLTLLRKTPQDQYSVIELGANHVGEIAYTTRLVKPDVALVNNVAAAHLEGFGSLQGVMQAKGEIFQGLPAGGVAIINCESHGGDLWQPVLEDKTVKRFSTRRQDVEFYATEICLNSRSEAQFCLHSPSGDVQIQLGLSGQHHVANALAAAALAMEMGASLTQVRTGLANLANVKGRGEMLDLRSGITLIDDSYNASVPAMLAAVDLLNSFSGQRWLILGNMAELGTESLALHRQVGEYAAPFAFDQVLTYGEDAKVISDVCHGHHFADHSSMIDYIEQQLANRNDVPYTLLVKGANSAGMSKIAAVIKEKF
ncbi:UDP-N-acetylmuramoyl-tripeptide--D-alanyl-D-alanine ligase [Vibrio sp.]|uniref:UDP-N-acetylmuramoyl-tripeptide--D-alanyl-D- alanine ligase n=1 Tax=Vibrio sp. TaxID=678 RepID=UPI003D0ABBF7